MFQLIFPVMVWILPVHPPWPCAAWQHERFPENDSPWLHLKSEPAERPIQRLRPVAHERRQWERRELRPVFGITERPSPTLAVAVHEIIPLDGAAMGTDAGQVLASHRLRILRTHAPIHVEQASERLGQQSGLVHPRSRRRYGNGIRPVLRVPGTGRSVWSYIRTSSRAPASRCVSRPPCRASIPPERCPCSSPATPSTPPRTPGRISMPMIRSPSSMDLSRTILSPPYHSPAQRRFGISGAE